MTAARALRPTRQEQLYDDAWDALRAGRFDKAAAGFARVLSESPRGPLGDEAAFWRATSLARGGHPEKALPAFEEYVATYRSSTRHNEAATILGWLLVDAHRPAEAVPLFRGATQDPDASVRKSAREGLAAATPR
jgi:TolA-binding protein